MAAGTLDISLIDEPNRWRLETPGTNGWKRTAHVRHVDESHFRRKREEQQTPAD